MLNIPHSCRVALLIDSDNPQLSHIEHALKISEYYGTRTICRAYGDWKQPPLSSWRDNLRSLDIEIIQQDRIGKNATDNRLMIEAGEIMGADKADIFIIVSGDSDFTLLCERIKQTQRHVIGIGNREQTSEMLRKACHEFYYIENLENDINKLETTPIREFERLLNRIFCELPQKDGWLCYAQIGTKLRELVPDFESN